MNVPRLSRVAYGQMKLHPLLLAVLVPLPLLLTACNGSYETPGAAADLGAITGSAAVRDAYAAKPAARFPANVAIVRVQASGYRCFDCKSYGGGNYSVVTSGGIENETDGEKLAALPGISQVVKLNRILLPQNLTSEADLRTAAAKLQTDVILLYTLDTSLRSGDVTTVAPLTTLTLGLGPTQKYQVSSTAAAVLMDTRTGYIYGTLEESQDRQGISTAWGSSQVMENAQRKAEREALDKMHSSFADLWARVYGRYR
jgi:hypothetical protein